MLKLQGKNIVIGVTGGIAVYKVCQVVRSFKKLGANVDVIMTKNATEFVTPLTFETLSNRPVVTDMFKRGGHWEVEHISLAKKADLFVVCPATANIVGKFANGLADDMLSTTLMATTAPVVICPAMNTNMYRSKSFNKNLDTLVNRGVHVVKAGSGFLACGDNGDGRMAEPETIVDCCVELLCPVTDLEGKKVLITCGATIEKLDDARYITNFSSGKMGAALVDAALNRGADVTVILGKHIAPIDSRATVIDVETTQQMYDETVSRVADHDVIVMAGAPCDYRPESFSESKIKSENLTLKFVKNPDIAAKVGEIKGDRFLCVFSAETDNGVENARKKLTKKHADLAVLNDVKHNDVFGSDTNVVTLVTADNAVDYPEMNKLDVANLILDRAVGK
ncbi:MAG: bifunctional phosphopantothenoylcysteine decarboxylase/phosphopantothenate--cysteine ligase CoaBC [Clostridiales bacterium]|nr:bifunctional phosphopantothenoylcysteine decarboxylase/phosphopantothenate--cysteine ligase CoaBC [Clostridiales bacterium]